jgi:2-alkenal reductase
MALLAGVLLSLGVACSIDADPDLHLVTPTASPTQPLSGPPTLTDRRSPVLAAPPTTNVILDGEEHQFADLFRAIGPSVVHVHVDRAETNTAEMERLRRMVNAHKFTGFRGYTSDPNGGSGFVFDADGLILTTNRVVSDAEEVEITFADGTTVPAMILGADPNTDLAVLKVSEMPATARPLQLGDSDSLRVGQRVAALGNPLSFGNMMTAGIVSAKARNVSLEISVGEGSNRGFFTAPDLIQTDATILEGAVGGPLVDLGGSVVGILGIDVNEQREFRVLGDRPIGGIGLSIPTSTAQRVVPVLVAEGRYPYPWLGISAWDLDPEIAQAMGLSPAQRGVLIRDVTPGSPADQAGLQASTQEASELGFGALIGGDVIVAFQSQPVRNFDDLVSLLFREGTVGETVTVTVIRDGEQLDLPLVLQERPQ